MNGLLERVRQIEDEAVCELMVRLGRGLTEEELALVRFTATVAVTREGRSDGR